MCKWQLWHAQDMDSKLSEYVMSLHAGKSRWSYVAFNSRLWSHFTAIVDDKLNSST